VILTLINWLRPKRNRPLPLHGYRQEIQELAVRLARRLARETSHRISGDCKFIVLDSDQVECRAQLARLQQL